MLTLSDFQDLGGKIECLNGNYINQSDFEEGFDYVVQMEDILGGSWKNDGKTYFNTSDCDSEFEGHKKIHQRLHDIDLDHANSSCLDIETYNNTWNLLVNYSCS